MRGVKIILIVLLVAVVLMAASPADFAQCAMCRASLNGSNNASFIRNLNIGVLVLLIPPVTIFCCIFAVLRRHKGEGTGDDA
jgi:hypothetical protein